MTSFSFSFIIFHLLKNQYIFSQIFAIYYLAWDTQSKSIFLFVPSCYNLVKNHKNGSALIKGRILRLHRYPQENMKTEVMEMTAYEAIMIMLTTLTLMISIISIVIKLLLYITKIMQKITTPCLWQSVRQLFYSHKFQD